MTVVCMKLLAYWDLCLRNRVKYCEAKHERSVSATVDGSGQIASWQKCVWSFISLEALVLKKKLS